MLASPADVNFIWYGNWSGNTATTILPQLIRDLNHTTYTNILSSYTSPATKQVPTETLNVGSSYFVTSSSSVQWQGAHHWMERRDPYRNQLNRGRLSTASSAQKG